MRILLSGYFGYDNAGDEAVLAAMLDHLSTQLKGAQFIATSGDPHATERLHASENYKLRAVVRDDFKTLWREIKNCDLMISGGGSLLQDVTSLRNIVYYTALIKFAQIARKPVMIYAQGIGPLQRGFSRQLTRSVLQHPGTRVLTVRDPDSKALLEHIGVRREISITADPVWALEASTSQSSVTRQQPTWCVSLRSWLDAKTPQAEAKLLETIRTAAHQQNATLKFLAMQPARDGVLLSQLGVAPSEVLPTTGLHPRAIMQLAKECDLMIGMRLHALIFAAAQAVPCIAVSYDPKVKSLAKLLNVPVIENASESELAKLHEAVAKANKPDITFINAMKAQAQKNAELAAQLI